MLGLVVQIIYALAVRQYQRIRYVFRLSRSFVRSSGQILLPRCVMNGLNNSYKTDGEYSPAPTDDLIRFWKSELKGQGYTLVQVCGGVKAHLLISAVTPGIVNPRQAVTVRFFTKILTNLP